MNKARKPETGGRTPQAAQSDAPLQTVPRTLYQRVTQGVRIAAWRQREEARFRKTALLWCLLFLGTCAGTAGLVAVTNLDRVLKHGISGGLGWFDYYASSLLVEVLNFAGSYTLITAVILTLGTLVLGLLPYGGSLRGH